jgi:hypothetical protein
MKPASASFRAFAFALLTLHLLVAGGGPVVDARLEATEREDVAHVEAERATPCTSGHDHLFCQVCRTISLDGGPGTVFARLSLAAPVTASTAHAQAEAPHLRDFVSSHGPRAPPHLS